MEKNWTQKIFGASRPFMVGIGGCGMSGLARLLAGGGGLVRGCDTTRSRLTESLCEHGIDVCDDDAGVELPEDCDLLVISAAVRPDHRLVLLANERRTRVLTYAEALGLAMTGATGVAIAGTHGKSTTTAMLGCVLTDAGLDPSVIVGATCGQLTHGCLHERAGEPVGFRIGSPTVPTGALAGRPGILLAEACEFNRSFHNLRPRVASIGAVEADHLDVYGSLDAVIEAFAGFARLVPPSEEGGRLLIAHDGAHRGVVCAGLDCTVETIGFNPSADWVVSFDNQSRRVRLRHGELDVSWTNRMPGEHNATNAATAAAIAIMLGAEPERVSASLGAFRGLDRRMQFLGERIMPGGGSVRVYDDYGHHPTEIDATLRALRQAELPDHHEGRLICVFQPHQHSRTRFLMEEFATSFEQADVVIVPQIYFVRDPQTEKHKVCSEDLVDRLRSRGVRAMHLHPFEAIVEQLENLCRGGDLLVVMGAGPVWKVARGFLRADAEQQI
ncbi:MAG: UDP-N-acetylmuramate--L-alanine ligase [Phycisphaerales bacterium]